MSPTKTPRCESCPMRKRAEKKPRSILAFLWRLHTKICPGWISYQRWLKEQAQESPTLR
jgi:hypothetical protein